MKKRGDRKDGRLLRTATAMHKVEPFIMATRNDANNHIRDKVEISEVEKYIKEKRAQGLTHFGLMHFTVASYVRTVSQRPGVNRFIAGQRIYARNNIVMNLDIKKQMTLDAPDTCVKVYFEPTDTAEDVYYKMQAVIEAEKGEDLGSDFDKVADTIVKLPRGFFRLTMWGLKCLDYHGHLPKALLDVSPFHGSFFYTAMGSLGAPPVVHHLYNFGNLPVFLAAGPKLTEYEMTKTGEVVKKKYMEYIFCTDDRVCDGFYFASALKIFKGNFRHPHALDTPPERVNKDID